MRIGFDAKRAFANTSGLGNYSRFIINSLLQLYPQDEYVLFTPKQKEIFRNFYPATARPELVQPAGAWRKLSALWRTFGLRNAIRQQRLDLYHGLSNELPAGIGSSGAKAIVTIHDLIFLRYPELYRPLDRRIYRQKFASACRNADKIVAISEQTKADIVQFFGTSPDKIEVVYQDCAAVFHEPAAPALLSDVKEKYNLPANYLLCVGTLEPRKNQLNLLKAWHQSGSELEVVLVGRQTAYAEQLKDYVQQHRLTERVHFLPYIPFEHLPAIYQLAQLFVYPSVFEGFGIPIVEALNSGVPVITSTGSCFSEAGGTGSVYVSPDDVPALAAAIKKVSANEALRQQMIQQGKQHTLQFRPEKTIAQLHRLYRQVLEM